MIKIFYVLLFCFQWTNAADLHVAHATHVSRGEIKHNTKEKTLQISLHTFIDDLELALKEQGQDKLFLCTPKENPQAKSYIENYLNQTFQLKINGKVVAYRFLGKEASNDLAAVWCYLEVKNVLKIKQLDIKNTILTEIYNDQKNMISILIPNKGKKSVVFDKQRIQETIKY